MTSFSDIGIQVKSTAGLTKTLCPKCSHTRKKSKDPCLSVNITEGLWKCHNPGCGFMGSLKGHETEKEARKKFKIPEEIKQYSAPFLAYFKKRKISETTLKKMLVYERAGWMPSCGQDMNKRVVTAHFPVFRDTTPVNVKKRSIETKEFMQISKKKGAQPTMIGLNRIHDNSHVIIVEGEIDMASFIEAEDHDSRGEAKGKTIQVISVPQGAPNPTASNLNQYFEFLDKYTLDLLRQVKVIYLAVDDDEPGEFLKKELGKRLGPERCRVVRYPKDCKDINDVLVNEGVEAVLECLKTSRPFPVKGLVRIGQAVHEVDNIRDNGFKRGQLIGNSLVDKYISIKEKMLHVITGNPGSGKTTWLDDHLTQLIKHNPNTHNHVAYYSPENRPVGRAMAKIMEKYVAKQLKKDSVNPMSNDEYTKAKYWLDKHFTFIYPDTKAKNLALYGTDMKAPNTVSSILKFARVSVEQYGSNMLVLDPWNKMEHQLERGESETHYISRTLDLIMEFGDAYNVAIFLIAHPAKPKKGSIRGNYIPAGLGDISGSANWNNKADVGIIIDRQPFWIPEHTDKPIYNPKAPTEVFIEKLKFEEIGHKGGFDLYLDKYRGDTFVNSKEDLFKPNWKEVKTKERTKQTTIELSEELTSEANDELEFEPMEDEIDLPF